VLFDVDWQGARALRVTAAPDVVGVFILPPDMTELERRLHARAQDDAGVIARRMAKSADEIKHWDEYDYVLVNHDLDETERHLKEILSAERQKRARQSWLAPFVEGLLGQKR
jgi:guanylate kinase